MWKKISSKETLVHSRLTVIEDEVVLPSGAKTTYLKFKHRTDTALVIAIRKDRKILLQKEYSYPQDRELYQFPGGALEVNESPEVGANRELAEEARLRAKKLILLGKFLLNNRRSATMVFVYLGRHLEKAPYLRKDSEEEGIKSFWFSEKEIEDMIARNKIIIFPVLSAWSLYKAKKNKKL
ncbi:MAG: NUDIX hydrolase [Candidatus Shapirobacteria bacterium]